VQRHQLRGPDLFTLDDLQSLDLEQKVSNLGIIGRIIVPLLHAPQIVFPDQVQLICASLEGDAGDIVDGEVAQEFLPHLRVAALPGSVLIPVKNQSRAAEQDDQNAENAELFQVHFAEVRFRL